MLVVLAILSGLTLSLTEGATLFAVTPNVFHVNASETISVTAFDIKRTVSADVYLQDWPGRKHTFSKTSVRLTANVPKIARAIVKPSDMVATTDGLVNKKRYVYVIAEIKALNIRRETVVMVRPAGGHVFIQTDKPMYNPTQRVHIRVIPVTQDMTLSTFPFRLDVINPQGVTVRRREVVPNKNEFIVEQFQFPKTPLFGEWAVKASYGYMNELESVVKFQVKEYVLPRYSVKITPPDYILPSTQKIRVKISARYVFGKTVDARCVIKFGIMHDNKLQKVGTVKGKIDPKYQSSVFEFKTEAFRRFKDVWFPDEGRLHLEVETTEISTGKTTIDVNTACRFVRTPYILKFSRSSDYFKPDLPYDLNIDGVFKNGKPAAGLKVRVKSEGVIGGQKLSLTTRAGDESVDEFDLNQDGQAMFRVDGKRKLQSLHIRVETVDHKLLDSEQAVAVHDVKPYQSPSHSYINVRIARFRPRVGDYVTAEVLLNNYKEAKTLNFMVVSRGRIVYATTRSDRFGVSVTFQFQITIPMVPSMRVVVYYVRHGGEVVSDSLWVDVEDKCEHSLSVRTNREQYRPDAHGDITVTGRKGARLGLLAVDKSVYLYRSSHILSSYKMFQAMERDDLGCGVGGGENADAIFKDAGLSVVSNTKLTMKRRMTEGCEAKARRRRAARNKFSRHQVACCQHGRSANGTGGCYEDAENFPNATSTCRKIFYRCCKLAEKARNRAIIELANKKRLPIMPQVKTFSHHRTEVLKAFLYKISPRKDNLGNLGRSFEDDDDDFMPSFEDIEEIDEQEGLRFRENFVESWLFEEYTLGPQGRHRQTVSFPSTVTEWVIQAVSVSKTSRMCVATPRNVTTFTKFFLDVRLPAVAVRMEQLEVVVNIFNYYDYRLPVSVYMRGIKGLCSEARPGKRTPRKRLYVPRHGSRSVTYPIMPLDVGEFNVRIIAFTSLGHDGVVKKLRVVHEGKQVNRTESAQLDPSGVLSKRKFGDGRSRRAADGKKNDEQVNVIDLVIPKEAIPKTESCSVYMIGDVMGPTVTTVISGMSGMLRLPGGCGEQTVIGLAPTVYAYTYLQSTGQLTTSISKTGRNFMRKGIDHELIYRKGDGSFSVWTTHRASAWLTAFVLKVFSQAGEHVFVDKAKLCAGVRWLLNLQDNQGKFTEPFWVYHKEMIGGVNGDATMSAFILITVLECKCDIADTEAKINRSLEYLEKQLPNLNRPLAVAMTTYALAMGNSSQAKIANKKLMSMAKRDDAQGTLSWGVADSAAFRNQKTPYWYQRKPTALAVETTAYALLAQLALNDMTHTNEIVVWLIKQRNNKGAFVSTQDTVVALQALSLYAIRTYSDTLDMNCKLSSTKKHNFRETVHLHQDDALVQKSVENVPLGGKLHVNTVGKGVGQMQVELTYHVTVSRVDVCPFEMNVTSKEINLPEEELLKERPCDVCKEDCKKKKDKDDDKDDYGDDYSDDGYDGYDDMDYKELASLYARLGGQDRPKGKVKSTTKKPLKIMSRVGHKDLSRIGLRRRGMERRSRNKRDDGASKVLVCVRVCARNLQPTDAGMSIIDVGLFTGFTPVKKDLDKLVKKSDDDDNPEAVVDKYEVNDRSVVFYLSTIPRGHGVCVGFRAKRDHNVQNIHPVAVNVYEYYEPSKACTEFYEPDNDSPMMKTLCRGRSCVCMEGRCPRHVSSNERAGLTLGTMLRHACRESDYVYKVKVKSTTEQGESKIRYVVIQATLQYQAKRGSDDSKIGDVLEFWVMKSCTSFNLVTGHQYIVMGREGQLYTDADSNQSYKYLLDDASFVVPFFDDKDGFLAGGDYQLAKRQKRLFRHLKLRGCPNK